MNAATDATSAPADAPTVNIVSHVAAMAERFPDKPAVIDCTHARSADRRPHTVTFRELVERIDRYAGGLAALGVSRGLRTILMVPPGIEFFALTFALFKLGAVPVLIDPGMGRRRLIHCLARVDAEAFIGIPRAHVGRVLFRRAFRSVRINVTVGRRWCWGGATLARLDRPVAAPPEPAPTTADDLAAILFTSGSTGPAKGVMYTHGIFDAQVRYLNTYYGFTPQEVDLATFPLFALFDAALGMTAVIPDMDASKPAEVHPPNIIQAIRNHGVTHMFGSPALLNRVSRYAVEQGIRFPTIRRVLTAGAPVPTAVLEHMRALLAESADMHTPYGATESLPVASVESREIIGETAARTARGEGICVGRPLDGMHVRIIAITDDPLPTFADAETLPTGAIGEICVSGPVVTRAYFRDADATRRAKIHSGETIWHRMGDVGRLDEQGRLWFCGRKAHRVETADGPLFTICCEAIFNQHPAVYRSALVGVGPRGAQRPVLCVELEAERRGDDVYTLTQELLALGAAHDHTRGITHILYHPGFPVDVRHNAKIFREKLAPWAAEQVG